MGYIPSDCYHNCLNAYTARTAFGFVEEIEELGRQVPIPRPLDELSKPELVRKHQIARVTTETLRYLTDSFSSQGFEWLLPVVLSKATDPLWPDPGASIEVAVEHR